MQSIKNYTWQYYYYYFRKSFLRKVSFWFLCKWDTGFLTERIEWGTLRNHYVRLEALYNGSYGKIVTSVCLSCVCVCMRECVCVPTFAHVLYHACTLEDHRVWKLNNTITMIVTSFQLSLFPSPQQWPFSQLKSLPPLLTLSKLSLHMHYSLAALRNRSLWCV